MIKIVIRVMTGVHIIQHQDLLCDIFAPFMFFNRKYLISKHITISSDGYFKIWTSCDSKEFGIFTKLFYNLISKYITISSDGYFKIWTSCDSKEFGIFTKLFYNLIWRLSQNLNIILDTSICNFICYYGNFVLKF